MHGRKELISAQEEHRQKQVGAGTTEVREGLTWRERKQTRTANTLQFSALEQMAHTQSQIPRAPLYFTKGNRGKNSFPEHWSGNMRGPVK